MVWNFLFRLDLFVRHCLLHTCGIDERILCTIAFCYNRHNGKNISIGMYVSSFFRFKTDGIVDGLVSNNGISGDVDKAYWFCGCDNSCHILINGELFDFLIRLLSHRGEGCQNTYRQCADSFKSLQFHNIYVLKLFFFVV